MIPRKKMTATRHALGAWASGGVRVVLYALALILISACDSQSASKPLKFDSVDITGVGWGTDLHLTDHAGKPRGLADFRGKVLAIYFGYTHCPDMCPTTMAKLARVVERLGDQAGRVQVAFITVDPARDTPEVLAQYVPAFNPTFLGLYGDERTTALTAAEFKVYFGAEPKDANGFYTVDHSSPVYVFDPKGRLRLFVRPDESIDAVVHDVKLLLES